MSTIRQEINILTAVLSAASGASATSNEIVRLDTAQYSGTITCYFEIVADTSLSLTSNVTLRRKGTSTDDATCTIPLLTTAYTRIRSASFAPPDGATEYVVFIDAAVGATKNVKAARIVIIQNSTALTRTETQIELGDTQTFTATTASALTRPKYFYFDSANRNGTLLVYLEVTGKSDSTKNTMTYSLQVADGTGDGFTGWADTGVALTVTATTATRTRNLIGNYITLISGRNYRVAVKTTSTKNTGTIYNAKLIILQTDAVNYYRDGTAVGSIAGGTATSGQNQQACAQEFTVAQAGNITGVKVGLKKSGFPIDTVNVDIVNDLTSSSPLASATIGGTSLTSSFATYTLTFSNSLPLTPGTTYYLRFTRTGGYDVTNVYSVEGHTGFISVYPNSVPWSRDNNTWVALPNSGDIYFEMLGQPGISKLEPQCLIANTLLAAGTALQNSDTYFDPAEWRGVINTYAHQLEAANGATSDAKLQYNPNSTPVDVTGSTVTNPDNAGRSTLTLPDSAYEIDVIATTNNNDLYASRILVQVVVAPLFDRLRQLAHLHVLPQ